MKNYAVYFQGHWPVGSVAVVKAYNSNEAKYKLLNALPTALSVSNSLDTLETKELANEVHILLDGNY
jgi:hypothetical protein